MGFAERAEILPTLGKLLLVGNGRSTKCARILLQKNIKTELLQ